MLRCDALVITSSESDLDLSNSFARALMLHNRKGAVAPSITKGVYIPLIGLRWASESLNDSVPCERRADAIVG